MDNFLGYIGQIPCDDFIFDCIKNITNANRNNIGISSIKDDKLYTLYGSEIDTIKSKIQKQKDTNVMLVKTTNDVQSKYTKAPKTSESFAVVCSETMTNSDNIVLPFNIFKKPLNIEDTMLYVLEYLGANSKNEVIKSTNKSLVGDLSFMYYDKISNAIYCQMGECPIVIGINDKFSIIANDVNSISNVTNKFIILQKGEKARITKDKITIYNSKNHKIKKSIVKLNNPFINDNDYYLTEQLFTISSSVNSLIDSIIKDSKITFNKLKITKLNAKTYNKIILVSNSINYYSLLSVSHVIKVLCDIPVSVYIADEYLRQNKNIDSQTIFIGVDITDVNDKNNALISLFSEAKIKGARTICITSKEYSHIKSISEYSIVTPQTSSDCTYNINLNTLPQVYITLTFFAIYLGHILGTVSDVYMDVGIKMAQMLPGKIAQSVKHTPVNEKYAYIISRSENIILTGCGIDYPIAMDLANNLSTITGKNVNALSIFELDNRRICDDTTTVALITNKDYLHEFKNILRKKQAESKIIVITNCNISDSLDEFNDIICVPDSLPIYNPMLSACTLYSIATSCEKIENEKRKSVAI